MSQTLATEAKSNPKKWWGLAKQIMGNQKISNLPKCTSNYWCKKSHKHPSYYNDEN
jgi:hypothetical protein